jgi:molybdenum cofactor cytidylyltransferase
MSSSKRSTRIDARGILPPVAAPEERFREALTRWFLPGAVYTFIGAGGKTTAMKCVAAFLADAGVKAVMTTTTRLGVDEFDGIPVSVVKSRGDFARAVAEPVRLRLLISGTAPDTRKYLGPDPRVIEDTPVPTDTVLLVEGDGSRKRPMKAPEAWEPVIPATTATVFALMGAGAFDEPIDEAHCYNHAKALAVVGRTGRFFAAAEIAALAADPEGSFKGVLPGMNFRLLVNQGDIVEKRETAREALELAREMFGIRGAIVSFQKGELYDTTDY